MKRLKIRAIAIMVLWTPHVALNYILNNYMKVPLIPVSGNNEFQIIINFYWIDHV